MVGGHKKKLKYNYPNLRLSFPFPNYIYNNDRNDFLKIYKIFFQWSSTFIQIIYFYFLLLLFCSLKLPYDFFFPPSWLPFPSFKVSNPLVMSHTCPLIAAMTLYLIGAVMVRNIVRLIWASPKAICLHGCAN